MFNMGTDSNFWVFIITVVPILLVLFFGGLAVPYLWRRKDKRLWAIWGTMTAILLLLLIARFVAFGAGDPVDVTLPEQDGIQALMEDTPDEDLEAAAESAKRKVPKALNQVRENLEKDEDEAFSQALRKATKGVVK